MELIYTYRKFAKIVKRSHISLIQLLLKLTFYVPTIIISTLILIQYYSLNYKSYSHFTKFSTNSHLSVAGSNVIFHIALGCCVSLVSSNLWWFLGLSLSFMILILLTCTNQLLCRWSSIWACLMFFHDLNEVIHFCQEYHRHDLGPFVHYIKAFIMSACLITGSVTHVTNKIVVSRFFHCKFTIFPFVADNISEEIVWHYANSISQQTFTHHF